MSSKLPDRAAPGPEQTLIRLREAAALLGHFDPRIFLKELSDEQALPIVREFAKECNEVPDEEGLRWQLKPDPRVRTLRTLFESSRLREVAESSKPSSTDLLGSYLKNVVLGRLSRLGALNVVELDLLQTAIRFVGPLVPNAPLGTEVELLLARKDLERANEIVLPSKLIGRTEALWRLRDFVLASPDGRDVQQTPTTLRLHGIGGAGKSALLAAFAKEQRGRAWDGRPVISLDFDRALLSAAEPTEMLLEFSRQLAIHRPELASALSSFRNQVRQQTSLTLEAEAESYDANASQTSVAWSLWNAVLDQHLPLAEPVILILDTYEEILLRGEMEAHRVFDWIRDLYFEGRVYGLRPILSGRAVPNYEIPTYRDIALGELAPAMARKLLNRELVHLGTSVTDYPVDHLVQRVGGNPLTLRILAKYLVDEGAAGATELLSERGSDKFDAEFARRFLYMRILKRIRTDDPLVERLAYPGLVLRRVSADIIEKVLAGPCGLQGVDAQRLFDKLAGQVWVVEPTTDPQVVRHRRELRRVVLQSRSSMQLSQVRDIHQNAFEYYRSLSDPYLTAEEQQLEAAYHYFFVSDAPAPLPIPAQQVVRSLGEDIDDLPMYWRARVKSLVGQKLSNAEVSSLGEDARAQYANTATELALRHGRVPTDQLLVDPRVVVSNSSRLAQPALGALRRLANTAFAMAEISELREYADLAIDDFFETVVSGGADDKSAYLADFTQHPLWLVSIASMGSQSSVQLRERLLSEARARKLEWSRPLSNRQSQSVTIGTALSMVLSLLGTDHREIDEDFTSRGKYHLGISRIEGLRAYQLLKVLDDRKGYAVIPATLLTDLRSDAPFLPFFASVGDAVIAEGDGFASLRLLQQRGFRDIGISLAEIGEARLRNWTLKVRYDACLNKALRLVIHGRSPELYPLIRGALRTVSPAVMYDFANIAQQKNKLWPLELKGVNLRNGFQRDRQRWTATLIEVADRCGLLPDLCSVCLQLSPSNTRLVDVQEVFHQYVNRLCME